MRSNARVSLLAADSSAGELSEPTEVDCCCSSSQRDCFCFTRRGRCDCVAVCVADCAADIVADEPTVWLALLLLAVVGNVLVALLGAAAEDVTDVVVTIVGSRMLKALAVDGPDETF